MIVRYALFAAAIGFSLGTLARSLLGFDWPVVGFMFIIAAAFAAAWRFSRVDWYALLALSCVAAALGAGRVMLAPSTLPAPFVPMLDAEVALEGRVADDPDIRETSQRIVIEVEAEGARARVLAVAGLYPELSYGDRVRVHGKLVRPERFSTEGGRDFAYDFYLAKDGIFAMLPRAHVEPIAPPAGIAAHALRALYGAKRAFVAGIEAALPEPSAGLASGLLVGGKQGLGRELQDAFTAAGLVHIVVLSGYNVMIVAAAFMRAARPLGKRASHLVAGASILAFVLAAGAGAASVRAGLMAALALYARASGRTYDALRALAAVVILMLAHNPLLLGYDVGFQFSIAATVGIIVGAPLVGRHLGFVKSGFLREIAATTTAAQAGVLPLLLYQTGMISPYALVANLLVLPLIPLAMLLSFAAALAGALASAIAPIIGAPAYLVLSSVIWVAERIATLPYAHAVFPAFSIAFVVLAYGMLALLVARLQPEGKGSSFRN